MGWREVYSQTEATNIWSNCNLASCDIGSGDNFINFNVISDLPEYHFKLVWNDGIAQGNEDVEMQWTQKQNPLSATDADMKPTQAVLSPSNKTPQSFTGLSISSDPRTLLDGMTMPDSWWYAIGNPNWDWHGGNPANYLGHPAGGYPAGATKTQLFVWVTCDNVNGICTGNKYFHMIAQESLLD